MIDSVQLLKRLWNGKRVANITIRWICAASKVHYHSLARCAPGELAVVTVDIDTAAVPNVKHQEFSARADFCMFRRGMASRASSCVAHENK